MPQPWTREDEAGDRFKPSQQGKKFLEKHVKENRIPEGVAATAPNSRETGAEGTGDKAYDTRDVGGTDFEIGEYLDPYHGIEVQSTGDVEIETATGDHTTISFSTTGEIKQVSVKRIVSADQSPSDIILYRQ